MGKVMYCSKCGRNRSKKQIIILIFITSIILITSCYVVVATDYGGKIYAIGTSISDGSPNHDNIHSTRGGSDDITHSYEYWFDYYMNNIYGVQTNLSDWYRNESYQSSWDKYSIGSGGGQTNDAPVCCNGSGVGDCSAYPYCCHCPPTKSSDKEDAMYMACVPAQVDGVYGREIWRFKDTNWSKVEYFIVEAGINEASDYGYFKDVCDPCSEEEKVAYAMQKIRGSVWSGMNGVYNRSQTYGFTFVLLKTLPCNTSWTPQIYVDAVNEEMDKFAELHDDIIYVDTFNTTLINWATPYTVWNVNYDYFDDGGVHPNKAGYQLMGKIIADAVYEDMCLRNVHIPDIPAGFTASTNGRFEFPLIQVIIIFVLIAIAIFALLFKIVYINKGPVEETKKKQRKK